ncbi:MAG: desulfoferrodoxin Dfx [Spirochaetaceae bacterium]|jgi:superoxide reductase|nr:desulfoferrodoxin Dfx [Spirochaetaceae bacterium]
MNSSPVFYICKKCGNIIYMVHSSGPVPFCCGEEMTLLKPNTVDAAQEKHVPVVTVSGSIVNVKVGSVPHPMLPEHHIEWIFLETKKGIQQKLLPLDGPAEAVFALTGDDKVIRAYEYCNLHGLWMSEAKS